MGGVQVAQRRISAQVLQAGALLPKFFKHRHFYFVPQLNSYYEKMKKGHWSSAEDDILREYVKVHGEGKWHLIRKNSILARSGKSCRLRWRNELRPDLKKSPISTREEQLLIRLHERMGNKWARMTKFFTGRTDNELKNFWNKRIRRCKQTGLPVYPVDGGSSRVSDQNHQQQIDAKQHHCYCNAQETPAFVTEHSLPSASRRVEDNLNRWEVDGGVITDQRALPPNASTFRDPSLYENPAPIVEHDEIHYNSDFWMPDELLEETQLKKNAYLVENSNPMSEGEIETLLEQVRCNEHKMELSEAINYEQPLAQDDHHFERESLNTTYLFENPAAIIESNESLDNSEAEYLIVAGLEDKHVLSQKDLSMLYEPLEENCYRVANFNPMSEDETETLPEQDFCNEHVILSDAINDELPYTAYGMLTCFEGHQGVLPNASESNKKEAAAVDVEPLPMVTMEEKHVLSKESLEQIWFNRCWNATFSGWNLAMDWELPSVQN